MSNAITKNKLKKNITVYKGKNGQNDFIGFKEHKYISDGLWKKIAPDNSLDADLAKKHLLGTILVDRAFMSTSTRKAVALRFTGIVNSVFFKNIGSEGHKLLPYYGSQRK